MLITKVKASAITNLTDARYFAAKEVEWLGFNLESDTENYIEPKVMKAIKEWVDGVKIVGEFNLPDLPTIQSAIDLLAIDQLQVGPFADHNTLKQASEKVAVIQEVIIETTSDPDFIRSIFDQNQSYVQHFILNFSKNRISWENIKQGHPLAFDLLKEWNTEYNLLLDMDFNDENINEILESLKPTGICLKGGEEEKVGYKSFDELDDIFDEIEELV